MLDNIQLANSHPDPYHIPFETQTKNASTYSLRLNFLRGHYVFIPSRNPSNLIGTCLKIVLCPTYIQTETGTLLLVSLSPCLSRCQFLPHHGADGHWLVKVMAATPHPSMKTSYISLLAHSNILSTICFKCIVQLWCLYLTNLPGWHNKIIAHGESWDLQLPNGIRVGGLGTESS